VIQQFVCPHLPFALSEQARYISAEPCQKAVQIQHFVAADWAAFLKGGPFLGAAFAYGYVLFGIRNADTGNKQCPQSTPMAR